MPSLLNKAQANHQSILEDIAHLVNVETSSFDLPGLQRGLQEIRSLAVKHLGEPDSSNHHSGDTHGDTLELTYEGTGTGKVLIVGHYDTVWPSGTLATWQVQRNVDDQGRETMTGPGIFDMKTGLVQGIWALKLLRQNSEVYPTVRFLFNGDEEIGSLSSRTVIENAAAESDAVLVLEPTSSGAVKTGRKGVGIFKVTATGVEAHAGLNPTEGASAIHGLAEFITAATGIANLDQGTSINVGLISGGTGSNVAAGSAAATIDIRVENAEEMSRVDTEIEAIKLSDPRVSVKVEHYWNRPPMKLGESGKELLELVRNSAAELGLELNNVNVGGGSDANFVAALGIPVLCGLGAVGDGAHARNEFIYTDPVPLYTALTASSLQKLANGFPSPARS
jgi:glutamate carboxypeptidase